MSNIHKSQQYNEKHCEYDYYGDTRNGKKYNEEKFYSKQSYNLKNLKRIEINGQAMNLSNSEEIILNNIVNNNNNKEVNCKISDDIELKLNLKIYDENNQVVRKKMSIKDRAKLFSREEAAKKQNVHSHFKPPGKLKIPDMFQKTIKITKIIN